jgi:hypothetical protein
MKKTVFLSAALLLACIVHVIGQDRQVSGTVFCSNDSIPLFAVSICIEGTTLGGISGENGEFSLNIPNECPSLIFNYLGMKTKQVELGDQKDIQLNVNMKPDTIELAEVTIAYNSMTRKSQSYITEFKNEAMVKINALVWADGLQRDEFKWDLRKKINIPERITSSPSM